MAKSQVDHYLPLFGRDFLTATAGWTADERGHYITLLIVQWEQGAVPVSLDRLELVSPGITSAWPVLEPKFPVSDDGMRQNARLEEHRAKCQELKEKRSESGRKGGRPKANGKQNESKTKANCEAKRKPPTPTPTPTSSLREEVIHTHAASREPWAGKALDRWATFREEWNQTPGAEPWKPLTPPSGSLWIDRIGESAWLEQYPIALGKLAGLKRFKNAVTLTQFLADGWVGRIVAGDFDKPQEPRGYGPPAQTPPQDALKRRYYRSDAGKAMTDSEYGVWRRDKRSGGIAASVAKSITVGKEQLP